MDKVKVILILVVLILLAVFFQESVFALILPAYLIPNLLVILIVHLAFIEVSIFGALLVFLTGLIFDVASGVALGPWAAAFIIVYFVFSGLSQKIFLESVVAAFLAVLVATLVADGVYLMVIKGFDLPTARILSFAFGEALVTAILAPVVFRVLKRVLRGERSVVKGSYRGVSSRHV